MLLRASDRRLIRHSLLSLALILILATAAYALNLPRSAPASSTPLILGTQSIISPSPTLTSSPSLTPAL